VSKLTCLSVLHVAYNSLMADNQSLQQKLKQEGLDYAVINMDQVDFKPLEFMSSQISSHILQRFQQTIGNKWGSLGGSQGWNAKHKSGEGDNDDDADENDKKYSKKPKLPERKETRRPKKEETSDDKKDDKESKKGKKEENSEKSEKQDSSEKEGTKKKPKKSREKEKEGTLVSQEEQEGGDEKA